MTTFKTESGLELPISDIKGKPYLLVPHRVQWFRHEMSPEWSIETEFLVMDENYTVCKATIKNQNGKVISTGHKREDKSHFQDHMEKAESGAIGRALAFLGYGTQFAIELLEHERIVDSPLERSSKHDSRQTTITQSPQPTGGRGSSSVPNTTNRETNSDRSGNKPTGHDSKLHQRNIRDNKSNDNHTDTSPMANEKASTGVHTNKTFQEIIKIDSAQEYEYTKKCYQTLKKDNKGPEWVTKYLSYAQSEGVVLE